MGLPFLSYNAAVLMVYSLGTIFDWRIIAWGCLIFPAAGLIAMQFVPESPVWLIQKGHLKQALTSLQWLRGDPRLAKSEYQDLLWRDELSRQNCQLNQSLWKICMQTSVLKPMVITYIYRICSVCSGALLSIYYIMDILKAMGIDQFGDLGKIAVYAAIVRLIFCVLECFLLYLISRRFFIISTSIGSGISSISLAIFLYFRYDKPHASLDLYVEAICLFVYFACASSFFLMIGVITGELLPARLRGRFGGYNSAAFNIFMFGVSKAFLDLMELVKVYGIFFIFGVASFGAAIEMYLGLPETKGQTLGQIEDYFQNEKWLWMNRSTNKPNQKHT